MGKLNDKAVQAAQSQEKQYGLPDGDGLSLIVRPNGTKFWWLRYRFGGKAKTLSIGVYPVVSLKIARDRTFEAKKLLSSNIDPSAEKQAVKAALAEQKQELAQDTASAFETVARDWFERHRKSLDWEDNHSSKVLGRLENDIFPWLGKEQLQELKLQNFSM
jgi:hypothetical protein